MITQQNDGSAPHKFIVASVEENTLETAADDDVLARICGVYFKIPQVAKACQVEIETVRNWIEDGRLKAHKLAGRSVRIHADDVAALFTESPPRPPRRRRKAASQNKPDTTFAAATPNEAT